MREIGLGPRARRGTEVAFQEQTHPTFVAPQIFRYRELVLVSQLPQSKARHRLRSLSQLIHCRRSGMLKRQHGSERIDGGNPRHGSAQLGALLRFEQPDKNLSTL